MTKSQYLCPVCKQPLSVNRGVFDEGDWFLYCPDGPCAKLSGGQAANEGEAGPTEREAYMELVQAVEWEQKNL